MRTLVDIPDHLLEELQRTSGSKTKKEAIVLAIQMYLDLKRREKLASMIGNYEFGYALQELQEMREDE